MLKRERPRQLTLGPLKSPNLRDRAAKLAADGAERLVDLAGQRIHTGNTSKTYQGRHERIFDQILTRFVPVKAVDKGLHRVVLQWGEKRLGRKYGTRCCNCKVNLFLHLSKMNPLLREQLLARKRQAR